jgi:kumamolisin
MRRFELVRHVSRRLAVGRRIGAPSAKDELRIAVLLHAKDPRALEEAVRAVSDPRSAEYGRFKTADDVRRLVAPGYQDLDAVLAWLHDAGLSPEPPAGARTVVHARGTLDAISRAFDVPFGAYALPAVRGTRVAAERNPTIPAALAPIVRGVAGLNELPAARLFPPLLAPRRSKAPSRAPGDARGPAGGYAPEAIRAAYGAPARGGAGERVGILEFGGGFTPADFDAYAREFGLSGPPVEEVSVSGAKNDYRGRTGDADVEVALDMDWVRAVAPDAALSMYWVPNVDRGWVDFLAAVIDAPEAQRPTVVSISWGMTEDGLSTSRRYDQTRQLFMQAALLGITFVCASGDAGAADELPDAPGFDRQRHVDFPSVVPEVTSVGGTKLLSQSAGFVERTWNDGDGRGATGGGFSHFVRVPDWQKKALGRRVVTGRGIPDVAAVASPDPGLSIRVRNAWTAAGGTSVAAPIWAAFLAQANAARTAASRPRLGAANAVLYALGAAAGSPFNDVTEGGNGYAGVEGYEAGKGWDPVTGLGSVNVGRFVRALLR